MKHKFSVTLSIGALLLGLTACGRSEIGLGRNVASDSTATFEENPTAYELSASTARAEPSTVQEICEQFLAGHRSDHIAEVTEQGWIRLDLDYDCESYCPGAVFPEATWTPEAVLTSYREGTAPWTKGSMGTGDVEYLWSSDYSVCFRVKDGWFMVNRVLVEPVDLETYSVAPEDLLDAYQSGEWDGVTERRSPDYSTTVKMDPASGELIYTYTYAHYPENTPYAEYAYTGYATEPCYDSYRDLRVERISTTTAGAPGSSVIPAPNVTDYQCEVVYTEQVRVAYYLDYPGGKIKQPTRFASYDMMNRNLYTMTPEGVRLYHQGTPLNDWVYPVSEEAFLALYYDGSDYLVTSAQVIQLKDGGVTDLICDDVIDLTYDYEGLFMAFLLNDKGELSYWHPDCDSDGTHLIATDVTDAWCYDVICYQCNDGYSYILVDNFMHYDESMVLCEATLGHLRAHRDYEVFRLGKRDPDFYYTAYVDIYAKVGWPNAMTSFLKQYADLEELSRLDGITL